MTAWPTGTTGRSVGWRSRPPRLTRSAEWSVPDRAPALTLAAASASPSPACWSAVGGWSGSTCQATSSVSHASGPRVRRGPGRRRCHRPAVPGQLLRRGRLAADPHRLGPPRGRLRRSGQGAAPRRTAQLRGHPSLLCHPVRGAAPPPGGICSIPAIASVAGTMPAPGSARGSVPGSACTICPWPTCSASRLEPGSRSRSWRSRARMTTRSSSRSSCNANR